MNTPTLVFAHALTQPGFVADHAQDQAIVCLQQCFDDLHRGVATRGVYLWGPVGRGKTWLMDLFFSTLTVPARRQHFHHFMRDLHTRLFALSGCRDPLAQVADELSQSIRLLCFDELYVNDIGDAMLLGRLFDLLFARGLVIVATSNLAPSQLYANGFNRERFVPAIVAIERAMIQVNLNGDTDHRLHPDVIEQRYFISNGESPSLLHQIYDEKSHAQVDNPSTLLISGRPLKTLRYNQQFLLCRFAALCEQAWAANDFISICDQFREIFVCEVPALSGVMQNAKIARGTEDAVFQVLAGDRQLPTLAPHDDSVRRFIGLVDECYDRKIPLYLEAAVSLDELYTSGYLLAPFQRTLSRLKEMQWRRFGQTR